MTVTVEGQAGVGAAIEAKLQGFHDNRVLKQGSAHGMCFQLVGAPNPNEIASKSNIVEVDLAGFHQTFLDIGVVRRELEDDVAAFQN